MRDNNEAGCVAIVGLVVAVASCIAAWIVVPEIRQWFGLDRTATQTTSHTPQVAEWATLTPPIVESTPIPSACVLPDVVQQDENVAAALISSLGLKLVKATEYHPTIRSGIVLTQNPAGDTTFRPCDGEVTIVVSLGPIPSPTVAPTPRPSATPIPEPPSVGGIYEGNGLIVKLVDYEIRPKDHPEDAAISYKLAFINQTGNPVDVVFSLHDISGIDNTQTQFGDYFALAENWYNGTGRYQCVSISRPSYPTTIEITVSPNSEQAVDLFLNVTGTSGNCQNWGVGGSRASFETEYVDLSIGKIKYRTDQLYNFTNVKWRLYR